MGQGVIGFPKPKSRIMDKHEKRKAAEKAAADFRLAVWRRDDSKCRICSRRVIRSIELRPERGEVHHLQTRGAHPDKKLSVKNGVLLCAVCHQKLTRKEIRWTP